MPLKFFFRTKFFLIEPTVLIIVPNICTYVANHVFRGPALKKHYIFVASWAMKLILRVDWRPLHLNYLDVFYITQKYTFLMKIIAKLCLLFLFLGFFVPRSSAKLNQRDALPNMNIKSFAQDNLGYVCGLRYWLQVGRLLCVNAFLRVFWNSRLFFDAYATKML